MPGTWLALDACELPPLLDQRKLWQGRGREGQRTSLERMAKSPLFALGLRDGQQQQGKTLEEGSESQHGLITEHRTWNQKTWFLYPAP